MTVAAVAVAFLAGTTMAALDSSTEQASPREGSSAGGSTALDPPRTGASLELLDPAFTHNSPDAQPPFIVAGAVVDMNPETALTARRDTAQRLAGDTPSALTVGLADQASATPVPLGAAEPKTAEIVVRTDDQSPVSRAAAAPAGVPLPVPAAAALAPTASPASAPAPAAPPVQAPPPPPAPAPAAGPAPAPARRPATAPAPVPEPAAAPPDEPMHNGGNGNGTNNGNDGNGNDGNGNNGNGNNGNGNDGNRNVGG